MSNKTFLGVPPPFTDDSKGSKILQQLGLLEDDFLGGLISFSACNILNSERNTTLNDQFSSSPEVVKPPSLDGLGLSYSLLEIDSCLAVFLVYLVSQFHDGLRIRSTPQISNYFNNIQWSKHQMLLTFDIMDTPHDGRDSYSGRIRSSLASQTFDFKHIVGCEWRLDYRTKSSSISKSPMPIFSFSLHFDDNPSHQTTPVSSNTETEDGQPPSDSLSFSCNLSQLEDLSNSLNIAIRASERFASDKMTKAKKMIS